jgi:hypothetical protein
MPRIAPKPKVEVVELITDPLVVAVFTDTVIILSREGKIGQYERANDDEDDYDDMPPGM